MDRLFEPSLVFSSIGSPQFNGDPDLIMLRDDLADEMGAIVGYLECAKQIREHWISEQFRHIAAEESGHYILIMRMIANLDPVQAEELKKQDLLLFFGFGDQTLQYGIPGRCQGCDRPERPHREYPEKKIFPPDERVLECLQNAIRDELLAINSYQKQISATTNPAIQNLLTTIMNKEKEHVSKFTRLIYELYQ